MSRLDPWPFSLLFFAVSVLYLSNAEDCDWQYWKKEGDWCFSYWHDKTWSEARDACRGDHDSDLPILTTSDQWDKFTDYRENRWKQSDVWLGLYRNSNGDDKWINGSSQMSEKIGGDDSSNSKPFAYSQPESSGYNWEWSGDNQKKKVICMRHKRDKIIASTVSVSVKPPEGLIQQELLFSVQTGFTGDSHGDRRFIWDFKDGSPVTKLTDDYDTKHTYTVPGQYNVTVIILNEISYAKVTIPIIVKMPRFLCDSPSKWTVVDQWCFRHMDYGTTDKYKTNCNCKKGVDDVIARCSAFSNDVLTTPYVPIADTVEALAAIRKFRTDFMGWSNSFMWLGYYAGKWMNGSGSAMTEIPVNSGDRHPDEQYVVLSDAFLNNQPHGLAYMLHAHKLLGSCMRKAIPVIEDPPTYKLTVDATHVYINQVIEVTVTGVFFGDDPTVMYTFDFDNGVTKTTSSRSLLYHYPPGTSRAWRVITVMVTNAVSSAPKVVKANKILTSYDPYTCPTKWVQKSNICYRPYAGSYTMPSPNCCQTKRNTAENWCKARFSYSYLPITPSKDRWDDMKSMMIDMGWVNKDVWMDARRPDNSTPGAWSDGSTWGYKPATILRENSNDMCLTSDQGMKWLYDNCVDSGNDNRGLCQIPSPPDYTYPYTFLRSSKPPVATNPTILTPFSACASGWYTHGTQCLKLINSLKTFDEARAYCEYQDGYLASFKSDDEFSFYKERKRKQNPYRYEFTWIGAYDTDGDGTFRWHDTNTFTYDKWKTGHPTAGECGVSNYTGDWESKPCTNRYKFICQRRYDPYEKEQFKVYLIHPAVGHVSDTHRWEFGDSGVNDGNTYGIEYEHPKSYTTEGVYTIALESESYVNKGTRYLDINVLKSIFTCSETYWFQYDNKCYRLQNADSTTLPYTTAQLTSSMKNYNDIQTYCQGLHTKATLPIFLTEYDARSFHEFKNNTGLSFYDEVWLGLDELSGIVKWKDGVALTARAPFDNGYIKTSDNSSGLEAFGFKAETQWFHQFPHLNLYSACVMEAVPDLPNIPMDFTVDFTAVNVNQVLKFELKKYSAHDFYDIVYTWDFGDGRIVNTATDRLLYHYFATAGSKIITLKVHLTSYPTVFRTLTITVQITDVPNYGCPPGWHYLSDRCYLPYGVNPTSYTQPSGSCCKASWSNVKNWCQNLATPIAGTTYFYTHLPTLKDKFDENAVSYMMQRMAWPHTWLGMNKIVNDTKKIYEEDGSSHSGVWPVDGSSFHSANNEDNDCALDLKTRWEFYPCGNNYAGLCQFHKMPILQQGDAVLTATNSNPVKGELIVFTLSTFFGQTHPSEKYDWDFGDGYKRTLTDITTTLQHTFSKNGTYTAKVTIYNTISSVTADLVITVQDVPYGCAVGWNLKDKQCLLPCVPASTIPTYVLPLTNTSPLQKTWTASNNYCQSLYERSYLTTVHNQDDLNGLLDMRYDLLLQNTETWFGLHCKNDLDDHEWANGTMLDYVPNNAWPLDNNRTSKRCGRVDKSSGNKWRFVPCSNVHTCVCQIAASKYIDNATVVFTKGVPVATTGKKVDFELNKFTGYDSTVHYAYSWADGQFTNGTLLADRKQQHAFANPGSYLVTVRITNAVSTIMRSLWIDAEDVCIWDAIIAPGALIDSITVTLTWTLIKGTQCDVAMEIGDGTANITFSKVNATFIHTIEHMYPTIAQYTIKAYAKNRISSDFVKHIIAVQWVVSELNITSPPKSNSSLSYWPMYDDVTILFAISDGSNFVFTGTIDTSGVNAPVTVWNNTALKGSVAISPDKYTNHTAGVCPGNLTYSLRVWNLVTPAQTKLVYLQVQYRFTEFQVSFHNPPWLNVSQSYDVKWSFKESSHYNCTIDWGFMNDDKSSQVTIDVTQQTEINSWRKYTHIHSHRYGTPGTYVVEIMCMNEVDIFKWNQTFIIQYPILDIDYSTNTPIWIASGDQSRAEMIFSLIRVGGMRPLATDAKYNYTFGRPGGQLINYNVPQMEAQYPNPDSHRYARFNTYTTTLTMTNLVSGVFLTYDVLVVQRFEDVEFTMWKMQPYVDLEPDQCYLQTHEVAAYKLCMTWGSDYSMTWDYKDGNTFSLTSVNETCHERNFTYTSPGNYSAVVQLTNAADNYIAPIICSVENATIRVQDKVQGFSVVLVKQFPEHADHRYMVPYDIKYVDITVELYVDVAQAFPGTEVFVDILWDDAKTNDSRWIGNQNEFRQPLHTKTVIGTKDFVYQWTRRIEVSAVYNFKIEVRNKVSRWAEVIPYQVYEEIVEGGLIITYMDGQSELTPQYHDPVKKIIWVAGLEHDVKFSAGLTFGTYQDYSWEFHDGWNLTNIPNASIYRRFEKDGWYNLKLTIVNFLSTDIFTYTISVERKAKNVSWWDRSPWPREWFAPHEYRINTGQIGTDACYVLDHTDTEMKAECRYKLVGNETVCKKFYQDKFDYCLNTKLVPQNEFFYSKPSKDLEAMVAAGNDPNITHWHNFFNQGKNWVSMTVKNHVSEFSFSMWSYVSLGPCAFPDLTVYLLNLCPDLFRCKCYNRHTTGYQCQAGDQSIGTRLSYIKDKVLVDANVKLNCTSSEFAWFNWTSYRVRGNSFKGEAVNYDECTDDLNGDPWVNYRNFSSKILVVPQRRLVPDKYKFSLEVTFVSEPAISRIDQAEVEISKSPLEAGIAGGYKGIQLAASSRVSLDAWSSSFDPDLPDLSDKTDISWRFYCKRACEAWPTPLEEDHTFTSWTAGSYTGCGDGEPGGCFDQGPCELTTTGVSPAGAWELTVDMAGKATGNFTLDTSKMKTGRWYVVLVVVLKTGDPSRYAANEAFFYVSDKPTLSASIRCVTNCNKGSAKVEGTPSAIPYNKLNPTSRFSLEAVIEGFDQKEPYAFNWTLLKKPSGSSYGQNDYDPDELEVIPYSHWLPFATTGADIRTLSIKSGMWNASNQDEGYLYRLEMCKGDSIEAGTECNSLFYEFFINKPPVFPNGRCDQVIKGGSNAFVLKTKIYMECTGFSTGGGADLHFYVKQATEPIDSEECVWSDVGKSKYTIIQNTADGLFEIFPSQGQAMYGYTVWYMIRVMDSYGSFVDYYSEAVIYPYGGMSMPIGEAKYTILRYARDYLPGEDYFQLLLKEQQTSLVAANIRRFAAMMNFDDIDYCPWDPCQSTLTRLDVFRGKEEIFRDENGTVIDNPFTTPVPGNLSSDSLSLAEKYMPTHWHKRYLGDDWKNWPRCEFNHAMHTKIRERIISLCLGVQIPYFAKFVQIISSLYPLTMVPPENSLLIMTNVEACMSRGLSTLIGKDAEMDIELEAEVREEAITSIISVVANMEETTSYFGERWRCDIQKFCPDFTMDRLVDWIKAERFNDSAVYTTAVDIWDCGNITDVEVTYWLNEMRDNITEMHDTLDRIKYLKEQIGDQVQAKKVMGEADSALVTPNVTAVFIKESSKKMTGRVLKSACGCHFGAGDSEEMFGDPSQQEESIQSGVECGKNNPYTTDTTSKNVTGNTVVLAFKNSTGEIKVEKLSKKKIDAFMNREAKDKKVEPVYNGTVAFDQPMILHVFTMYKDYGLTLHITKNGDPYDLRTTPPPLDENLTTTAAPTTAYETTTVGDVLNGTAAYTGPGEQRFAVFVKCWKKFGLGNDFHGSIQLPHWELDPYDEDANASCSTAGQGDRHTMTVSWADCIANDTEGMAGGADQVEVFVAVRSIPAGMSLTDFGGTMKIAGLDSSQFKSINYTIIPTLADCKWFDRIQKVWRRDGMVVGPLTTFETTHCIATHLTSMSSGFELPMNSLDLENSGFKNLAANPVAFIFCLCILALYLIVLIWARRKDKEDHLKAGLSPLPDNDPRDRYLYEVTFYTGQRSKSGTTANVCFILTGTDDETDMRQATDVRRPAFRRNGIDTFIMACPRTLGKMTHLRIWHDNSGEDPSWYFSRMQITDIQTGHQFFFVNSGWLAVEEGDGIIDKVIPIAGKDDLTDFNELFWQKSKKNLFDGHIWFSVFRRPPRSHFTRVQRWTCCLSLVYCTMVANIMFFGTDEQVKNSKPLLSVGPITVTLISLVTALISGAIVVPVNVVLVMIFRYAKPKPPPTPQQQYEKQMKQLEKKAKKDEKLTKKLAQIGARREEKEKKRIAKLVKQGKLTQEEADAGIDAVANTPVKEEELAAPPGPPKTIHIVNKKKKKFSLPWWFIYIGYSIAFVTVAVGFWLIVEFAGVFGKPKAIQWVISMFISLIQSILFVQPIKILFLATIYAVLIKKPDKDEDEPEEIMLREDEVYLHDNLSEEDLKRDPKKKKELKQKLRKLRKVAPPNVQWIQDAREKKLKEIAMWKLMKEIIFYVIFLYTVMMVAYGTRDEKAYHLTEHGYNTFEHNGASNNTFKKAPFSAIRRYSDFYTWAKDTLLPGLYPTAYWNGESVGDNYKYISDHQGYLVSTARFRMLRMIPTDTCKVPKLFKNIIRHCRDNYNFGEEDEAGYKYGWVPVNRSIGESPDPVFTWHGMKELRMQPFLAVRNTYWGGGYLADLGKTRASAEAMVAKIEEGNWINEQTRALFIEFSVFYPAPNMFLLSQMLIEWTQTGSAVVYPRFELMRLDPYAGANAMPVVIAEVCVLLFMFYFIYREGKELKNTKPKKQYFLNFWNITEMLIILLTMVAIAMYAYRTMIRKSTVAYYKANPDNFTNFAYPLFWEQLYGYMIYVILFIANLKFLRLLRFNKKISFMTFVVKHGWRYIMNFVSVFFIVFTCFCMAAFLLFNKSVLDYANYISTMETLLVIMLNKFRWENVAEGNAYLGPVFFFVYALTVNFVMINMLLSIINDTFSVAKDKGNDDENDGNVIEFIWWRIKKVFGFGGPEGGAGEGGRDYLPANDEVDDELQNANDRVDDMLDQLEEFLKEEKQEIMATAEKRGIDIEFDADGVVKKKAYVTV